jgi:signal peptidase I
MAEQSPPSPPLDPDSRQAAAEAEELIADLTQEAPAPAEGDEIGSAITSGVVALLRFLFNWLIIPGGIVLGLHFFVFQAYHVVGSSMYPTLHGSGYDSASGDYLIISKIGQSISKLTGLTGKPKPFIPKRGQVVIFIFPLRRDQTFVKRVIALPGERVTVKDGRVRVYNQEHSEGFDPDTGYELEGTLTEGAVDLVVPDGNIFVIGDNRAPNESYDSRAWGPLPTKDIIGIAVMRLLPINQIRLFSLLPGPANRLVNAL